MIVTWVSWLVEIGVIAMMIVVVDRLSLRGELFNGRKDDERKHRIKEKSMSESYAVVLLFLVMYAVKEILKSDQSLPNDLLSDYPGVYFVILAAVSYSVFYFINSRRMSA